jgi:superfamily II DNA/RNA helicase
LTFHDFNLHSAILEGIDTIGFKIPTPIQEQTIPHILNNKDIIACAQTGTGKTAAYLLPILDKLSNQLSEGNINTLVIVPTRELALQIDQQVQALAYFTNSSSYAIYGGGDGISWDLEKRAITSGVDIVIATPGRLMSHINLGYMNFSNLQHLVLDEADKMLDMGFYEDILRIVSFLPKQRQTLMFSATMPHKIRQLAKNIMKQAEEINIAVSKPAESIIQVAYLAYNEQKLELTKNLLQGKNLQSVLIFSSTKIGVKKLEEELKKLDLKAKSIHSDLEQAEREKVLIEFKNREFQILAATDILSRGIDIKDIDLVINFDTPSDAEDYVHRIGRTGRAETSGVAITYINEKDVEKFQRIEKFLQKEIIKIPLPELLGKGPEYVFKNESGKHRFSGKSKKR